MKIHTISCWQEFSEEEIQEVIDEIRAKLRPIRRSADSSRGTVLVFIKSDQVVVRLVGFTDKAAYQINHFLNW